MIPIAKPFFNEKEITAAKKTILSGWVGQGPKVKQFEDAFASYVGSKYACAVSSCTTALHLALLIVGVKPGDAVITVSHSFIATANSIRHCGAEPVFVDIDPGTFNMSRESLEKCLKENCANRNGQLFHKSGRVAAILPVHQMGMPCDLKSILFHARKFNIPVVEDAACAIGTEIKIKGSRQKIGKPHGDVACFSFHPRKLIATGEGGMLTTGNSDYDRKFRLLRQHGMSVSDLVRHSSKKIIFEKYLVTGYNYKMSDIQAAVGIEQLRKIPKTIRKRKKIAGLYRKELKNLKWLRLPSEPAYCKTNWQSYPVRVLDNSPVKRDNLMRRLLEAGISTRRGVMNAHQEPAYACDMILANSESARDSVILLPMFYGMTYRHVKKIAKAIKDV
jgi:dTDP-4-amino-4,6-dideoxygalactose transaminase